MILIASLLTLVILAGLVIGTTNIIVKTDNPDFKNDPEFYKALGNHLAEQEDYTRAIVAYETYLLLAEDMDVRNNLAVLYYRQARYTEAISQLRVLINSEPENPSYHYDLAVNLVDKFRNTLDQEFEYLSEALEEYETADELSPGYENAKENADVLREVLQLE